MDAASLAIFQSSVAFSSPSFFRSRGGSFTANLPNNTVKFGSSFGSVNKQSASVSFSSPRYLRAAPRSRRSHVVRASLSSESSGSGAPVGPLKLESPVGQFLWQILNSHPHLLPAAVEQQLEQLQTDRDSQKKQEEPSATGSELVLYRRIAEVKASERRKVLEEILYALVVQRFMEADVSLIPSMNPSDPSGQIDSWPTQEEQLKQLHSAEAYEMIQNHLSLILGNRLGDSTSVAQISKLRVSQVYAASVMYGYFLKRVDQRFQLEKAIKTLQSGSNANEFNVVGDGTNVTDVDDSVESLKSHPEISSFTAGGVSAGGFGYGIKPSRLRTYVMSFDGDTLQRYATIRSKEAVGIIEKHTEALFGRPEIVITPEGMVDTSRDELIKISFGGLKRLVLEAVTFGSFLWDVESFVDSRYHFVTN